MPTTRSLNPRSRGIWRAAAPIFIRSRKAITYSTNRKGRRRRAIRCLARRPTSDEAEESIFSASWAAAVCSDIGGLTQNQNIHPLGHFPHWDAGDFFQSLGVNDRHRSKRRVRNIDEFAVRRKRNPVGHGPSRLTPQRVNLWQLRVPDQLQIGERVFKDSVGKRAVNPQRFSIRGHPDSVRRNSCSSLRNSETSGLVRQLDPGHLRPLCEVDNCESVKPGELDENAPCRAVGICLEGHGAYWAVELNFPCRLLAVEINHGGSFAFDRAADRIFAIWCDVHVVHGAAHGNALYPLKRGRVDYIEDTRLRADANQHLTSILGDGEVVRPSAERYLASNFPALSIHHIEHTLCFIADVDPRPVGREGDAVRQLDATYYLHDLVRRGIDNVDSVAGAIRNIETRYRLRRGLRNNSGTNAAHPFRHGEPVGVVLRSKLPAPRVKRISSSLGRKRMEQEPAGSGIPRNNQLQNTLEVSLRLLVGPVRVPLRQRLEMKDPIRQNVATVAAGVLGPVLQEDWLDLGLEELETKCGCLRGTRGRLFSRRRS